MDSLIGCHTLQQQVGVFELFGSIMCDVNNIVCVRLFFFSLLIIMIWFFVIERMDSQKVEVLSARSAFWSKLEPDSEEDPAEGDDMCTPKFVSPSTPAEINKKTVQRKRAGGKVKDTSIGVIFSLCDNNTGHDIYINNTGQNLK